MQTYAIQSSISHINVSSLQSDFGLRVPCSQPLSSDLTGHTVVTEVSQPTVIKILHHSFSRLEHPPGVKEVAELGNVRKNLSGN